MLMFLRYRSMKNFIRLCSFFLFFFFLSCSNKSNGDVVIKPSVKENAKPLVLEEVQLADKLEMAINCFVYDILLIRSLGCLQCCLLRVQDSRLSL